jgi:DNA ligase-1
MGDWSPSADFYRSLIHPDDADANLSRPYPFCLAHPIDETGLGPEALGDPNDWQAEWKWDGIRCQLIRRKGETFLWTRGEELVTDRYPELSGLGPMLPDGTVIDGEILVYRDGVVQPFAQLQRRIGRKTVGKTMLTEVPVALFAFDLLEIGGEDLRSRPLWERRERLAGLVEATNVPGRLVLSPTVEGSSWAELAGQRATSRERLAEGLMLKRRESIYQVGRVRGDWWKWKISPITVDAVLTAAQRGSGKRASLYTDYTFSVWDESGRLVPIAKAYSGLTDEEIRRVDAWIRRNMVEKFGPVRTVTPELVFELAFEGIQRSSRHKSGVAVRFPRIARWRTDKKAEEADRLETILALIAGGGGG